jgi:uncharacterized protein (UPF0303 family)
MALNEIVAKIARQERTLTFAKFDEHVGWELGCYMRDRGCQARSPIVIDVRQFHRQLFFAALPGSNLDNIEWVRRKVNVVERFHRSSYAIGQEMAVKGSTLEKRYGLPVCDYAEHGGAFPINVDGCGTIGCMTVSGLAQHDDHMLVIRALCEIQNRNFADFDFTG